MGIAIYIERIGRYLEREHHGKSREWRIWIYNNRRIFDVTCDLWQCDNDVMPTLTPVSRIEDERKEKKRQERKIKSNEKSKET